MPPIPHPAPRRLLRRGLRTLLLLLGLALLTGAAALLLALQTEASLPTPSAKAAGATTPWAQARGWLAQVRLDTGGLRRLVLRQADVNALLEQLASSPGRPVRAQVAFEAGRATALASWPLTRWPGQPWLNVQLVFDIQAHRPGQLPPLVKARVGHLPLPASWVQWGIERTLAHELGDSWQRLPALLRAAHSQPQTLTLVLQVQRDDMALAVAGLLTPAERAALRAQGQAWRAVLQAAPAGGQLVSVAEALQGGARVAQARVAEGADAGTELHALLLHLGLHATGRSSARLADPASTPLPEAPAPVVLVLAQRTDMAQHFLLSTLLAWQGGQRFSNALGLGKELADTRGGSGFSFNDLAGDLAGTRFGRLAQAEPVRLLDALAVGLAEPAFFPEVADLPEYLSEAQLQARFGGVGAPAYEAQLAEIRRRVAALPLHAGR
jgi:uncharacterized protein YfiM (DUF2279 family)